MATRIPCREWLVKGYQLSSTHEWEHDRNGPTHCTRCGKLWAEFDRRARDIEDMYLEAYSQ